MQLALRHKLHRDRELRDRQARERVRECNKKLEEQRRRKEVGRTACVQSRGG